MQYFGLKNVYLSELNSKKDAANHYLDNNEDLKLNKLTLN
jgi:hypothetical protein